MTAQQNGLRFDIYERVHLFEGVLGIKELEGVEMVPHIQVLPHGEQAVLRGNLLLSGTYVDEQERAGQTLEHLIPVEITLPMNRVNRVEDISVEIENFDVDLLSARSLNVTGVLSLNGLEMVSPQENETWKETEEEVVFVHEAGERTSEPESEPQSSAPATAFETEQALAFVEASGDAPPIREEPAAAAPVSPGTAEKPEEEAVQVQAASEIVQESAMPDAAVPEAQEMKIALGIRKPDQEAAEPVVKSYGLSSLLKHPSGGKAESHRPEEAEPAAAPASEKVEWKNILLSSRDEKHEFKRLRMCIVQKEETLETIAKRYDINPREIALHNRLGDGEVSEGQVVYIPK